MLVSLAKKENGHSAVENTRVCRRVAPWQRPPSRVSSVLYQLCIMFPYLDPVIYPLSRISHLDLVAATATSDTENTGIGLTVGETVRAISVIVSLQRGGGYGGY